MSQIIGLCVVNLKLVLKVYSKNSYKSIARKKIIAMALKFKNFPKYTLPAGIFSALGHQLIPLSIPILFNITVLGMYSLTNKVLSAPSILIASALSQVFLNEANSQLKEHGSTRKIFVRTVFLLVFIGLPIYSNFYLFSEEIFAFVFGEEWRKAGVYAGILTPLFFSRFVVSSVMMMNIVHQKNKIAMYWQLIYAFFVISILYVVSVYEIEFENFLKLISGILSVHYLLLLIIMSRYK